MNRERDIERVLDAWLQPGPTVTSDRLFDDVLERIDRQPQRRLARVQLRFTTMRPTTFFGIAAAILVAVGAGVVLLGRPSTANVGSPTPPPSLAPAPSASAAAPATPAATAVSALPTSLRYRWIGTPRTIPGLSSAEYVPLLSMADPQISIYDDLGQLVLGSTATTKGPVVTFTLVNVKVGGCTAGDVGTYHWSLSTDGTTLELSTADDACAARAAAFSGTWARSACRDLDGFCLGPVPAGTYVSTLLDLRSSAKSTGSGSAYGQLRYAVPDGWANSGDWRGGYSLQPAADYAGPAGDPNGSEVFHAVDLLARPVAIIQDGACTNNPKPDVDTTPAALAAWVAGNPSLDATAPQPITINGRSGVWVDVTLDPAWTAKCGDDTFPSAIMLGEAGQADGWVWGIGPNEKHRLIFLDIGGGDTVMISIDDNSTPSRFDELVAQAMPVIETFEFPE